MTKICLIRSVSRQPLKFIASTVGIAFRGVVFTVSGDKGVIFRKYGRTPVTRTLKGKELTGVRVIGVD